MGKFIIDRESNYVAFVAKYDVYLDNRKIDSISNGDVKEYVVENGRHTLYLKNALLSFGLKSNTVEINITENKVVKVMCKVTYKTLSGIHLVVEENNDSLEISDVDKYDQLEKVNELKKAGVITEEEYELEKKKILNGDV